LQDELINLVENLVRFYAEHKDAIPAAAPSGTAEQSGAGSSPSDQSYSTNTIAAHLSVTSATELAIAAVAHLAFVKKQAKHTRREIDAEMKSATTFYNKNMSSNLSSSLTTLVKARRLNQIEKDVYALAGPERATLGAKLAQLV
jgi:hypothetical protein